MAGSKILDSEDPRQLVAGTPAVVKKELIDLPMDRFERSVEQYLKLAGNYLDQNI